MQTQEVFLDSAFLTPYYKHSSRSHETEFNVTEAGTQTIKSGNTLWKRTLEDFVSSSGNLIQDAVYSFTLANYISDSETKKDLAWFTFLQKNHQKELSIDEMSSVIEGVHELMRTYDLHILDDILKSTLNSSSSNESIVSLLRASFTRRNQLPSWNKLLNNSKSWILAKNEDPKEILEGLI